MTDLLRDALRRQLLALPSVTAKRMFGAEAYFAGAAMFAFFAPDAIVLRLPGQAFTDAVGSGLARPFLSLGATRLNGWAAVTLDGQTPEDLRPLLRAAHVSGTRASRQAGKRRRPAAARRVRPARRSA